MAATTEFITEWSTEVRVIQDVPWTPWDVQLIETVYGPGVPGPRFVADKSCS